MDPNQNYKDLRKLLDRFNSGALDDAGKDEALGLADDLLGWMAMGGFPPAVLLEAFEKARSS
jgi:hypothetical protein